MSGKTSIEWTDATWNPVRGCSRVSEGCRNCYAERVATRFSGPGQPYEGLVTVGKRHTENGRATTGTRGKWNGVVRLVPEHLDDPIRWQRPRRVFVNSMSDLFHENLDDEQIDLVFAAMLLAPRHTFQVLTKRPARMRAYLEDADRYESVVAAADRFRRRRPELSQVGISNPATHPAPWIWLGVSVENQAAADERIPELLATPATVRFLSCEPLLGPVDVGVHIVNGLHWVIAGCESGPGARSADLGWYRSLRDQCARRGVAFFLKQATQVDGEWTDHPPKIGAGSGSHLKGKVIGAPYLDGVQHLAFPEAHR